MIFVLRCKLWGVGYVKIVGGSIISWENIMCKGFEEGKDFLCMKDWNYFMWLE